jgi:hypothetical protein
MTANISKINDEQKTVFGWASIIAEKNGDVVVDHQEHFILPHELEKTAYDFVLHTRRADEMHKKDSSGIGTLVESVMLTKEKQEAMGIPEGVLPIGWWIGFKIYDDGVWDGIKSGKYSAFSIGGRARIIEQQDEA